MLAVPGEPVSRVAPSRAWLLLGALPLVLVALVRRGSERGRVPVMPASAQPLPTAPSGSELGYGRREPEPVAPAPLEGSARAFLAEYHGAAWPEVEARLVAAGVALDVPYYAHPWEEAEPEIRAGFRLGPDERAGVLEQKFAWPAELTQEWVRAQFDTGRPYPLGEEDLPVLADLVADLNLELLGKAELYCDLVDATLQARFERGEYVRQPYSSQGAPAPQGFYATAVGALGWAATMALSREEHPELAQLLDEMRALRQARSERVVRYLHGKIGR